jgi:hypothetical protein
MLDAAAIARYRDRGYAIVRGFLAAEEVDALGVLVDRVHAEGVAHGRPFRHGNLYFQVTPGAPPLVRMVQWPAWLEPALDRQRTDPRYLDLLAPLIGVDLKQIIHQLHWKPAGPGGDFAWHQDSRSRRPREAYRNLGDSYVQTGLALDPHTMESGCLRMIPGSHRRGDLKLREGETVLGRALSDADLRDVGVDPATQEDVLLAPGDLALWSPFTLHASGANTSGHQRRLLINGYVRASDCDRGEWAFREGEPVPLPAVPSLVHHETLHDRPEPHYP